MPGQIQRGNAGYDNAPPSRPITWLGLMLAGTVAAGMSAPTSAEDRLFDANRPLEIADQGVFSIPGRYVEVDKQTIMVGQMFVQYQIPKNKTRPYPVGMIHAAGGPTASSPTAAPSTSSISPDAVARDSSATSTARRASRRWGTSSSASP